MDDRHIFPFLWVHGESEETYRKMVGVIDDANIHAFCVEARPHPDFAKDPWWHDMEIILDEAERRGMKVWILDDKHFPTGYAAGAVEHAPLTLRRRTMTHRSVPVNKKAKVHLNLKKLLKPDDHLGVIGTGMLMYSNNNRMPKPVDQNELLSITAYGHGEHQGETIDLSDFVHNGELDWRSPDGEWTVEICGTTYDSGMHRNYINMIDEASCRLQIEAVYEPHYAHFGDRFGTVIAGFFSDEPELGNGNYVNHYNYLGTDQTLPYSQALKEELEKRMGPDWAARLPLLWLNDQDEHETACVRYQYMDAVTRLVETCFSKQIGDWCRAHGVEYIGHVIEDNNQHARTSTSLGHYYRGLKWQSMAGIDDIGGQVYPDGEDKAEKSILGFTSDGEFYHYALGKLGSSLGILNSNMQGRTMCEIFGAYGWEEGVYLEKYLADHFMVRGVNHFVPHAFDCKDYPDKDCPPHFYAHGHNPQYRHFGQLMLYMERICSLIDGGKLEEEIAVLYHGEAEWTGKCMLMQKPGRILAENQIDFCYLPSDVFEERAFYQTRIDQDLHVAEQTEKLIVVPYAQYLNRAAAEGLAELLEQDGHVVFLNGIPDGTATGEALPSAIVHAPVITPDQLLNTVKALDLKTVSIFPEDKQLRVMKYTHASGRRLLYVVNEASHAYQGELKAEGFVPGCAYDAWRNEVYPVRDEDGVQLTLDPHESVIFFEGGAEEVIEDTLKLQQPVMTEMTIRDRIEGADRSMTLSRFRQSVCKAIDYPDFGRARSIDRLEGYELTDKKFSGFIRYETSFVVNREKELYLEISEAHEGVEVFLNGQSLGIQINPHFRYDLTPAMKPGQNELRIEVATTLERENKKKASSRSGITGTVTLYSK